MARLRPLFSILIPMLLSGTPARALSPPWFFVHSQVEAALAGPGVRVDELASDGRSWVVPVEAIGEDREATAAALATVLRPEHLGGLVRVEVRVDGRVVAPSMPQAATPAEAAAIVAAALAGNPHLGGVYPGDSGVVVEAVPEILQFYADDISDRHGLAHFPAAGLFGVVLAVERFEAVPVRLGYAPR